MGLLDDAIREHLELKRKHGADPGEVDRQIEEALGPPQRAEFAETPEGEAPEAPVAEAPPADEAPEAGPVAVHPEPTDEPEPFEDEPFADEPPRAAEPEPAPQESEPFDVESIDDPQPATPRKEGEEDVLQDTPDFLQETPEHDRLWFEQRPPRDFDWDK